MSTINFAGPVAQGAGLLDKKSQGWCDKIDTDKLNMWNGKDCIVGQLAGIFWNGLFWLAPHDCMDRHTWAVANGFTLAYDIGATPQEREGLWALLTDAWLAEIARRRER